MSDNANSRDVAIEPEDRGKYLDIGPYADNDRLEHFDAIQDVPQQPVTDEMLLNDVKRDDSWLHYNKGYEQTGFSPADQITPNNVGSLTQKYAIETEDAELRTNPIIVPTDPPVMYFTENNVTVHAVNARTGEEFWRFAPELPDDPGGVQGYHRGVAVWGDNVYATTPTTEVIALDRYTGEQQWRTSVLTADQEKIIQPKRISITQTPVVYDGMLYTGQSGDFGGWTVVLALDAETGEIQWHHRTAPKSEWVGDSWKFASAAAWMSAAVDPKSETVIWSVGNPDPMMNAAVRPGPNKHSDSVLALDAKSGDIKWAHQIMPSEVWDYDAHATPTVFDMQIGNETRRVVSTDYKAGWVYVFDVETGMLLRRSEPFARQDHTWSDSFLALPPKGKENAATMWPAVHGATEWPPDAYSPQTGMRYIGANFAAHNIYWDPDWQYKPKGDLEVAQGGGYSNPDDTKHAAAVAAVDMQSGDLVWRKKLDDIAPDEPMETLFTGGTTATAGNVVFHGSSGNHLYAFDAKGGEQLWKEDLGGRITPSPVVWRDSSTGVEHVSVTAGGDVLTYATE